MREGELFADRFEVRRIAGKGGMSIVYRATDRASGEPVAVKVLRAGETELTSARFAREGRVLSELRHPGIVRYVAHGTTKEGEHYLTIEWLEGEDLARRLRRAPMTIPECITLAKRVANALGYAHQRGILHRDVKPSNIFLRRGRVEGAKILDFGIARLRGAEAEITAVGTRLGTPAYMSPEQARGIASLDARTDIFSLGCVLFQCLTRRRPFFGTDPTTVIAKILLEDAPPARALRPEVPPLLDNLLTQMLAKNPASRPADGSVVAEELEAVPLVEEESDAALARKRPSVLTRRERKLHSVVMIRGLAGEEESDRLSSLVEFYGGQITWLPHSVSVVTLSGTEAATDLAAKAARCALAIRDAAPKTAIALATGRDVLRAERASMGPVLDRAAQLLRDADLTPTTRAIGERTGRRRAAANPATATAPLTPGHQDSPPDLAPPIPSPENAPTVVGDPPVTTPDLVRLDDVTAGLLDARFEVSSDGGGFRLVGERLQAETTRTLLSKPTECVSREAELGTLQAAFDAVVEEPCARVLLITAAAGVGKSRLRYELVRRLEARGSRFQLLMGRSDPLNAGAPFGVLASAIRRAADVYDGEPAEVQRAKLRARLSRLLPPKVAPRVVEFVGELVGVPFPDSDSIQLRAARQDTLLMGDQMRRAAQKWLATECHAIPTILVLEDLHWGDLPTVSFVDSALRALADEPLLVLALARNEIEELFPRLWADRGVQHIRLATLSKKACRKLARQALGDRVDEEMIERVVERSAGNAFYLEELIRAAAEGDAGHAPQTVLAMLQARLEKMEPEARRILRAASVFGRTFWRGGVAALLGDDEELDLDGWLTALVEREVIRARTGAEFPGESEYAFRHDLVREAAYAMLTDSDRSVGHALAGAWLEKLGASEPAVLAEHFERGNLPARAVTWYLRSAEQAMVSNDFAVAYNRAERGVSCGAAGEDLGALRLLQAEALNWQGDFREAVAAAREAKSFLPVRSHGWFAAIGETATAAGAQGDTDQLRDLVVALGEPQPGRVDERRFVRAATHLAEQLLATGLVDPADRLLEVAEERAGALDPDNPDLTARIHAAKASRACVDGNAGKNLEFVEAAAERFDHAGDLRNACQLRARAGYARMDLGAYEEAEKVLREAMDAATRLGLQDVAARARLSLGVTLGLLGNLDESSRILSDAADEFSAFGNRRMHSATCAYLALIRLECNDSAGAERNAKRALDLSERPTLLRFAKAFALAVLARVMLAGNHTEEAFDSASASMGILEEAGGIDEGESIIRVTYAEALYAVGDVDAALAAVRAARDRLYERANRISPHWRTSFLYNTPAHADTLRLAEEWGEAHG